MARDAQKNRTTLELSGVLGSRGIGFEYSEMPKGAIILEIGRFLLFTKLKLYNPASIYLRFIFILPYPVYLQMSNPLSIRRIHHMVLPLQSSQHKSRHILLRLFSRLPHRASTRSCAQNPSHNRFRFYYGLQRRLRLSAALLRP